MSSVDEGFIICSHGSVELNIFQIIWSSGLVVKLVLLSLILASVVSLAIVWKKWNEFKALRKSNQFFLEEFNISGNLREVSERSEALPQGPLKILFARGFVEVEQMSRGGDLQMLDRYVSKFGLNIFSRALDQAKIEVNQGLERHLSILASIGAISPFVGLFGTVWGIVNSFTGLAAGGNSLDAVAPGIAEALVATAVGLFAAIPAVWFYNYFSNENDKFNSLMKSFSKEFLNSIERMLM